MNTHFTKEEKGDTALLFLHGWGCDGTIFANIAQQVHANSYMIDLWGFGNSDSPPEHGWTVVDYADMLYVWLTDMHLAKLSIVAHSFGARVAVVLASRHVDMVDKLVLVGGAGMRRFSMVRWCRVCWYKLKKLAVAINILPQSHLANKGSIDYINAHSACMHNTFVKVVTQDLSSYASNIVCPTLLVWGNEDTETPLWMAHRYNKLIADSQLIVLDGGHFVFVQHSRQFANIINALLKG